MSSRSIHNHSHSPGVPLWINQGYASRFQGFQNLIQNRIVDILLVSSEYDLFVFEEDGRLYEQLFENDQGLSLAYDPVITRVSSGKEALEKLLNGKRFDLVISTLHIEDMHPAQFLERIRVAGIDVPVVLMAFDNKELKGLPDLHKDTGICNQVFIWLGDYRLILAIIKNIEDKLNIEHDTDVLGVQTLILIEDNIRYYSSFLPLLYEEIMKQSQRLISEGLSLPHKKLRQRARPKILLCTSYEEAMHYFTAYHETVLGILSDVDFPKNRKAFQKAGFAFAREVRNRYPDIPILLHSGSPENARRAEEMGVSFLLKESPTLLQDLREFVVDKLGFGDFIFRTPDGNEIGRAGDLASLEAQLMQLPLESIIYHAERNHFSNWLKARTEFWLAYQLRPRKVTDFNTAEATRENILSTIIKYRQLQQQGTVTDFKKETFNTETSISRIGGGSLGGKGRGLCFLNRLLADTSILQPHDNIRVCVPPAVIVGSDVFDFFISENNLLDFALGESDDRKIVSRFIQSKKLPETILDQLSAYLTMVKTPVAVRSSSLLEDSHNYPFAGIYHTYMLPNTGKVLWRRLDALLTAIIRVYASVFLQASKSYMQATSYRLEEEKMAVVIQKMMGGRYGACFYPALSGVARSYNYYPLPPQKVTDGVVHMAFGLGKMIMEGGQSMRFCPNKVENDTGAPAISGQAFKFQKDFFALDMERGAGIERIDLDDPAVKKLPVGNADMGLLKKVTRLSDESNQQMKQEISGKGKGIVSLAPVLNDTGFPIHDILGDLLEKTRSAMGTPVELEFAVHVDSSRTVDYDMGVVQMRPMVIHGESDAISLGHYQKHQLICRSSHVLGNGCIDYLYDAVVVDRHMFERSMTGEAARDVHYFNKKLASEKRRYLLIGLGRWGSMDPGLGIPVTWDQISSVGAIVEADFDDLNIEPSYGSHFFQNLISFGIGYMVVSFRDLSGYLDWEWLLNQRPAETKGITRLLRFQMPLVVKINGHARQGIILKPGLK